MFESVFLVSILLALIEIFKVLILRARILFFFWELKICSLWLLMKMANLEVRFMLTEHW